MRGSFCLVLFFVAFLSLTQAGAQQDPVLALAQDERAGEIPPDAETPGEPPAPVQKVPPAMTEGEDSPERGAIEGAVRWLEGGDPAPGAAVTVELDEQWRQDKPYPRARTSWTAVADKGGFFRFDDLPLGVPFAKERKTYMVIAEKDGASGIVCTKLEDDQPAERVRVLLYPSGAVTGQVLNAQGEPIAGAMVSPYTMDKAPKDYPLNHVRKLYVVTDRDGRFSLGHLPLGGWWINVLTADYAYQVTGPFPTGGPLVKCMVSKGGSAQGVVLAAENETPVEGLLLFLKDKTMYKNVRSVTTNAEGRFVAHGLADGEYVIVLEDETWLMAGQPPRFPVRESKPVADLEIMVARGGMVSGRVYDADTDAPVEGVCIRANPQGYGMLRQAMTDALGRYAITGIGAGPCTIERKWKLNYTYQREQEQRSVFISPGQQMDGIDFPIKRGIVVRGRVVDPRDKPVEGVQVSAQSSQPFYAVYSTVTSDDGAFALGGFPRGVKVDVMAKGAGHVSRSVSISPMEEEDASDINVVAMPGAGVDGTVVDETGQPLANVQVAAIPTEEENRGPMGASRVTSREDGGFKIGELAPGRYSFHLTRKNESTGGKGCVEELTLAAGQQMHGLRLTYRPPGNLSIAGQVSSERGEPIDKALVHAYAPATGASAVVETGPEGQYEITGLQQGAYEVEVKHRLHSLSHRSEVEAGSGPVDFVLKDLVSIAGYVTNAQTGQPIPVFEAGAILAQEGEIGPSAYPRFEAFHVEDGRFRLTGLPAGKLFVCVRAPGYASSEQLADPAADRDTALNLHFKLEKAGIIEGAIVDDDNAPVANAEVYFGKERDKRAGTSILRATTDTEGRFHIESVAPGNLSLYVDHPGLIPTWTHVTIEPGVVNNILVVLQRGGVAQGTVLVNGKPASRVKIYLHYASLPDTKFAARTDENGRYRMNLLPDGEATLTVSLDPLSKVDWERRSKQAEVRSGLTVTVDFNL